MKKVLKSIFAFMICFVSLLAFTACGNTNFSKTTNDTTGVVSNGGVSVTYNGYVYFINGTKTNNEDNNTGKLVQGAIYKAQLDENGNVVKDSYERVVDRLVGFKNGQIFIFGDFLYYSTPCRDKNKAGEMLTGKTEFRRYDLKKNKDQLLYVSASSDDTLTYTYYKDGENLNLVVYEKTSATLKSIRIGDKVQTLFTKENVKSAIFSDNAGESKTELSLADQYIFFTLSYEENGEIQHGVRVYKIKADGTGEQKISEGESVTLLTIRAGRLVYSLNSYIYSAKITNGEDTLSFEIADVVCYKNYENILFLEDDSNSVLVVDNDTLRTISWKNGTQESTIITDFSNGDNVKFIGIDGDYLIYLYSKNVYKIKFKNATDDEMVETKLSTTSIDEASDLIAPEINNGYVYGMYTDSSKKQTYLYRINLKTPAERGEKDDDGKDKEIYEAEFIGIKE